MIKERTREAFELNERLTVIGKKLQSGDIAPDFTLDYLDLTDAVVHQTRLADSAGTVRLLSIVNSLDTPVCHIETRRWEGLRTALPAGVSIYTVSMDLPFAQARWQSTENVIHPALSAHRSEQFGQDYGVLLKEWRLLQRAVFVIDRNDRIVYAEYVANQMHEPDYLAAMEMARRVAED